MIHNSSALQQRSLAFSTKVGASESEIVEVTLQETVTVEDYPGDDGEILTVNGQVIVL